MTPYVTQETIAARTEEWLRRIEPYNKHDLRLNVSKSALMVVDMQQFFLEPGSPTFTCGGLAILPALKRMIAAFRSAGRPVIFTRHVHHPDDLDSGIMGWWWKGKCLEGSPESEVHPELAPLPNEKCALKDDLGIEEVTFHKRTPLLTDRSKVLSLIKKGAKLCVDDSSAKGFQDLGMEPSFETTESIDRAGVVIDCTPSGVGTQNKTEFYDKYTTNTLGFIAQGSESGFGKPYARGVNDSALIKGEDQFVQVVSCNTHNLSILIETLALDDGGPENLHEGRFVCMRRSNDISQDTGFVPSPQVGKHKDVRFGTHHARDAWRLFQTMGYDLNLFSTALKLNTQYMHTIFFDIRVKEKTTLDRLHHLINENDRMAVTYKDSANAVFSFGRDQGHYGRILNVCVIALPTLTVRNDREIVGYCFTPQDGNSLLSSISAATWFLYPDDYEDRIQCVGEFFHNEV